MAEPTSPERSNAGPVEVVPVDDVYELRREVLRRGTPTDNVNLAGDVAASARHLAVRDDAGVVIATSSWSLNGLAGEPTARALQLRAMAVHPDHHRRGLGAALIDAGVAYGRQLGVDVLWANARDTALAFYQAQGFTVVGEGFLTADTRLPHHVVVRRL